MAPYSFLERLQCSACGAYRDPEVDAHLCDCGGPLLARYDLAGVARELDVTQLRQRNPDIWRYHELLPVRDHSNVVALGEGMTPLCEVPVLAKSLGVERLYIKDEGINPTGSFKARGASAGVSRARELGAHAVVMPTAGNAGGAWAAYGARASLKVVLYMPDDAPQMAAIEAGVYGSDAYFVRGQVSDAGVVASTRVREEGWYDATTLKEPYRLEGKKTIAFEIAEQMDWHLPDAILFPTGGGVGVIGIYKALLEMEQLGWISRPFPKLIAIQATGCAPIVRALQTGRADTEFWPDAHTIASGIRVPKALGDFLVLRAIRDTQGTAVAVDDDTILASLHDVAIHEGIFMCPEGAAAVAGLSLLLRSGFLRSEEVVVLVNTATGLKYPDLFTHSLPYVQAAVS